MANKTTGNFIGIADDYAGTSGAWSITEARERGLTLLSDHGQYWSPPVEFIVEFLVIGGGGGGGNIGNINYDIGGGGGAGGYLNSFGTELSGGSTSSLSGVFAAPEENFTVTIGAGGASNANGSNSVFSGTDSSSTPFNHTAVGGGRGAGDQDASNGGSGGGGGWEYDGSPNWHTSNAIQFSNGAGTSNQGTAGAASAGAIVPVSAALCNSFPTGPTYCFGASSNTIGGGGGGAGSAPPVPTGFDGGDGGDGLASSITGTSVTRAGGGGGEGFTPGPNGGTTGSNGTGGAGSSAAGGGGQPQSAGQDGTVILRYPNTVTINFDALELTGTTAALGAEIVTTFTAGSGTVYWTRS